MTMNIPTESEIAWAAGLFEGEGTICFSNSTILISVNMTDKDILEKFFKIVQGGYFNGPYKRPNPKWKDSWQWRVQGGAWCQTIIAMFWPWLGERRKQQFKDSMESWKLVPAKHKVYCTKGHLLEVLSFNGASKGSRGCRTCINVERRKRYRIKNPEQIRISHIKNEYEERPKRNRRNDSISIDMLSNGG